MKVGDSVRFPKTGITGKVMAVTDEARMEIAISPDDLGLLGVEFEPEDLPFLCSFPLEKASDPSYVIKI